MRASAFGVAVLVLAGASARAEEPTITNEQISTMLRTYYGGENRSAVPFLGSGAASLAASGVLLGLTGPGSVGRGAAWPMLGFGVLEVAAGLFLGLQAPANQVRMEALLAKDPHEFARVERRHMDRINHGFQPVLLVVEGVITLAGGALATVGAVVHQDTVTGLGLGFALEGLLMFVLDWAVLDRALAYSSALSLLLPQPALR